MFSMRDHSGSASVACQELLNARGLASSNWNHVQVDSWLARGVLTVIDASRDFSSGSDAARGGPGAWFHSLLPREKLFLGEERLRPSGSGSVAWL